MAAVAGNARARLVARVNAGRLGNCRCGWVPKDTADGNASVFYMWEMVRGTPDTEASGADPTWTSQLS